MTTPIEFFEELVAKHDLTYTYSDDGSVYRRGRDHEARIMEAAKSLPPADVERIWNAMVDKTLAKGAREAFYWR